MNKPVSLYKNVTWMFVGTTGYAFCQWIQLSLISKLCTPVVLGSFTLALAITAPIFMFLSLQLRTLLVTDSRREYHFSNYFFLRLITLSIGAFILAVYALVSRSEFVILFLIAALKIIEGIAEIFNALQQLHEQMHHVACSFLLRGISATLSIATGIIYFDSLAIGLLSAIFINSMILYFNDYNNCKKYFIREQMFVFKNLRLKYLFLSGLPLGFVMGVISLNTNISKYFAEFFLGTEKQGIYSTVAYCLVLGNFVNAAIGQSFSPRMSKYFAEHKITAFKKLCKVYVSVNAGMGFLLFALSLVGGQYFLRLMFNEEIALYTELFSWSMFSGIFIYISSALGYTLSSMRVFNIQPIINSTVMIINAAGCLFFIQAFGLKGVVYASTIAFILQIILTLFFIKKRIYD